VHLADGFGCIPLIPQRAREGGDIVWEINAERPDTGIWVLAGHDACAIRHAGRVGNIGVGKSSAFACELIKVRGLQNLISSTAKMISPLLISYEKDDIHVSLPVKRQYKPHFSRIAKKGQTNFFEFSG